MHGGPITGRYFVHEMCSQQQPNYEGYDIATIRIE